MIKQRRWCLVPQVSAHKHGEVKASMGGQLIKDSQIQEGASFGVMPVG